MKAAVASAASNVAGGATLIVENLCETRSGSLDRRVLIIWTQKIRIETWIFFCSRSDVNVLLGRAERGSGVLWLRACPS